MSSPTGALIGLVCDANGRPIAQAAVMIGGDSPDHPDIAAMTGTDGRFCMDSLPPGRYVLVARSQDGRAGQVTVSLGDTAISGLEIRVY